MRAGIRIAHTVKLSVFCREHEDYDKLRKAMVRLACIDEQKDRVQAKTQNATGFSQKQIKIITAELKRQPHIRRFQETLAPKLSDWNRKKLLNTFESRLDKNFHFFLRLDKALLLEQGTCQLVDHGDCFHIMIAIECFPHTRERAKEIVESLLNVF